MLIGYIALSIIDLAGVIALFAAGIAGLYVYRHTRGMTFTYWAMFALILAIIAFLFALDPYNADFLLDAITSPSQNHRGPVRRVETRLNVFVPYALVFFFSAPVIARYCSRRTGR